jgi:hypothetical protein
MTKATKALDVGFTVGFGLLAVVVVSVSSPTSAGVSESQMTHETVTVTAIDRPKRQVTLKNPEGESKTVDVPQEVKAYDTLKVGDRIDLDYYESVAVSLAPKGTKPSVETSSGVDRGPVGSAMGTHTTTISAEILAVDAKANKITIKGPSGGSQTIAVQNPDVQKKLPMLKVGQVVQLTYTEAVAASIRKPETAPAPNRNTNMQ